MTAKKHMTKFDMTKLLVRIKKEDKNQWLNNVNAKTLEVVCSDLDFAYSAFFNKRAGYPKFKKRKSRKKSFPLRQDVSGIWFNDSCVKIPSIGFVKYKTDMYVPKGTKKKFVNPRISFDYGKWFIGFSIECDKQAVELNDYSVGIDLGIKDLAVTNINDSMVKYGNINKSAKIKKLERRKRFLQKSISRKYNQNKNGCVYIKTNNIKKQEFLLFKTVRKMASIRKNYIYHTISNILSNRPSRIVMEDLNVSGLMKNRYLSKNIQEQCWGMFIDIVKYKCDWLGIEFVQVPRFYPSSKTCSSCGNVKTTLSLKERTYVCECCGLVIDRDYNAAINLSRYIV